VSAARRGLAAALVCLLAGCSPVYVLRAALGEAKILWRREPFAQVLARPDLDPEWRRKILLVEEVRRFATTLGLDVGGSFASLSYVDEADTVFVVSAARQTVLEPYTWWFPIVGRLPYKGFFDPARAQAEAARLEADGYDTLVRPAAAFSTLGWFDDPLLQHLLANDDLFLVDLVLHETYHRTFFLKGAQASAFNESLASFVGHRGAAAFFVAGGDAERAERAEARWRDEQRFGAFMRALVARLEALYAAADAATVLAARARVFAAAQEELAALPFEGRAFAGFARVPLNNAVVLHYRLYNSDLDLFERVWQREGSLRAALDRIEEAARREPAAPFAAVRAALPASPAGVSAVSRRR
jgi:predicted aminopeptidase